MEKNKKTLNYRISIGNKVKENEKWLSRTVYALVQYSPIVFMGSSLTGPLNPTRLAGSALQK